MLLSSAAEAMFWTGRYLERAQAVARAALAYQRMSLDLPGVRWLDVRPLLGLTAPEAPGDRESPAHTSAQLRELVLDADNPSTVLGALCRARANLRRGRVATPFEVWVTLNAVYVRLSEVDAAQTASVLALLGDVVAAGTRIEGEITATMTRDTAYSFLRIGCHLERADMLVRTMKALLPVVSPGGPERAFDDVRWMGLLDAVGAHSMYRRRHHTRSDLPAVLEFLRARRGIPAKLGALPPCHRDRAAKPPAAGCSPPRANGLPASRLRTRAYVARRGSGSALSCLEFARSIARSDQGLVLS